MATPLTLGFIGLGNMGMPIATHLGRGGAMPVFDRASDRVVQLAAQGACAMSSAQAVACAADVVFLSLPTPDVVEAVVLGDGGLIGGDRVRTVVDLSTTGPRVSAKVAAALAARGIGFLDAPVSGGVPGATAGTLTVMASGDQGLFRTLEPALRSFARNLFYIGPQPGQGQLMKLVNNMLIASCAVASFEVPVTGAKAGLDASTMLDVINVSSGRNWVTMEKVGASILRRNFPPGFATELLLKDVNLGLAAAEELGTAMGVVARVREFLAFAVAQGDGSADYATIIRHLEGWAGVELRA